MIGRLFGKIVDKSTEGVLLDISGVGYEIALPLSTLASLPSAGETAAFWIHTYVREDDLRLFGFASKHDRAAFQTMLKISGVGPKLALTVIGALSGAELARVVQGSDAKRLSSIPGIGKKTAERMILELGGKLKVAEDGTVTSGEGVLAELASALKNLGFKSTQVERALGELKREGSDNQPFDVLLRQALGFLQGKR